jgi:hypothetical protein
LAALLPDEVAADPLAMHPAAAEITAEHPGGAVLFGAPEPPPRPPLPDAAAIRVPRHRALLVPHAGAKPQPREVGVAGGPRVMLVGDSHAQHWEEGFAAMALERGWSLVVQTKMACVWADAMTEREQRAYEDCHRWGERVFDEISRDPPELVITSHARGRRVWGVDRRDSDEALADALQARWAALDALGVRVLVVPDLPRWSFDPVECALRGEPCRMPLAEALGMVDVLPRAVRGSPASLLDLTDLVCPDEVCRPVIGNLYVFRDDSHLTPEYAASLAPGWCPRMAANH